MTTLALVNGQPSKNIPVSDRGLAYGDGLFETIQVNQGGAIRLADHLERLANGCDRLHIHFDIRSIQRDIKKLLSDNDASDFSVLKIILTRETTGRSYQTSRSAGTNRIVSLVPLLTDYTRYQTDGVAVCLCNTRLPLNPELAGIKHLCRLENVLARAEWQSSTLAEGLMLDTQGRLVEGTMSNVFLFKDGGLYTPSLHRCGVEGIIRKQIINNWADQLGLAVTITDVTLNDVYQSQELFVCNSLIGIWPVTLLGCHRKKVGNVTRALQKFLINRPGER